MCVCVCVCVMERQSEREISQQNTIIKSNTIKPEKLESNIICVPGFLGIYAICR